MDELLTFAYADPATLTIATLAERLGEGDGQGMFAMATPTQEIGLDGLQRLQQELRELFEATADGRTTPTVMTTVHHYPTKPPGRMPPRPVRDLSASLSGTSEHGNHLRSSRLQASTKPGRVSAVGQQSNRQTD